MLFRSEDSDEEAVAVGVEAGRDSDAGAGPGVAGVEGLFFEVAGSGTALCTGGEGAAVTARGT